MFLSKNVFLFLRLSQTRKNLKENDFSQYFLLSYVVTCELLMLIYCLVCQKCHGLLWDILFFIFFLYFFVNFCAKLYVLKIKNIFRESRQRFLRKERETK